MIMCGLTVVIPICFGFVIFLPVWPEYWLMNSFLEIPFGLEWKYAPLIILMDYCILQGGDMVFWFDLPGMLVFQESTAWLYLLEPQSMERCSKQGTFKLTCRLDCNLTLEEAMQLYEEQRYLSRCLNNLYGHFSVTTHHATFIALCVLGMYVCIRQPAALLEPGLQLALLAVFTCEFVEAFEMTMVTRLYEKSASFLASLDDVAGMCRDKRKVKIIRKYVGSRAPLNTDLAYPFYQINRESFMAFQNQFVDFLVNLLVSTNPV